MQQTAYIGLGSNMGRRDEFLRGAVRELSRRDGLAVARVSSFIETDAVGGPPQGRFLNAAAEVRTSLPPGGLLAVLHDVEDLFGRQRGVRWGPRTLDLDLLLYGDVILSLPDLVVPHPLMHARRFVLEPLCEIAPDAVHPVLGKTVRALLADLPAKAAAHEGRKPANGG